MVHEKLASSPLNKVSEDNGIRSQLLITLFLKSLEAKKSGTETIPDFKDIVTVELDEALRRIISTQVKDIYIIF